MTATGSRQGHEQVQDDMGQRRGRLPVRHTTRAAFQGRGNAADMMTPLPERGSSFVRIPTLLLCSVLALLGWGRCFRQTGWATNSFAVPFSPWRSGFFLLNLFRDRQTDRHASSQDIDEGGVWRAGEARAGVVLSTAFPCSAGQQLVCSLHSRQRSTHGRTSKGYGTGQDKLAGSLTHTQRNRKTDPTQLLPSEAKTCMPSDGESQAF